MNGRNYETTNSGNSHLMNRSLFSSSIHNSNVPRVNENDFYSTRTKFARQPTEYIKTIKASTGDSIDIYKENPWTGPEPLPEMSSFQKSRDYVDSSSHSISMQPTTQYYSSSRTQPPNYQVYTTSQPISNSNYTTSEYSPTTFTHKVMRRGQVPIPNYNTLTQTIPVNKVTPSPYPNHSTSQSGFFHSAITPHETTTKVYSVPSPPSGSITNHAMNNNTTKKISSTNVVSVPNEHPHEHGGSEEKSVTKKKTTIRRKKVHDTVNTLRDSYIDSITNSLFNNKHPELSDDSESDIAIPPPMVSQRKVQTNNSAPLPSIHEPITQAQAPPVFANPPPVMLEPITPTQSKLQNASPPPMISEPIVPTQNKPRYASPPTQQPTPVTEDPIQQTYKPKKQSNLPFENLERNDRKPVNENVSNQSSFVEERQKAPVSTYSAHKENLRNQQTLKKEHSPNVRTMPAERRTNETTEEVETITLQPIGKGVQDLASSASLSRPVSRAQTPRVTENTQTMKSSSYFRDHNSIGGPTMPPNTAPSARRMNKAHSSRNIETIESSDQRHFFANSPRSRTPYGGGSNTMRQASTSNAQQQMGYTTLPMQASSNWHTRSEMYRGGQNGSSVVNSDINLQAVLATEDQWYHPNYDRDQAIDSIKDKTAGSFVIRNSTTYTGAYALAIKVNSLPQNAAKTNDPESDLVRHFLIESVSEQSGNGVRIKGLAGEPVFPSLAHLVHGHCMAPLGLPTTLLLPGVYLREDTSVPGVTTTTYEVETREHYKDHADSSASATNAQMQRSASNPAVNFLALNHPNPLHRSLVLRALYLGKVDVDRLNNEKAIAYAVNKVMSKKTLKTTTVEVEFDSTAGMTITDKMQKLFYTRQFPAQHVLFAGGDPSNREFSAEILKTNGINRGRIIGVVIRKQKMMMRENVVHLFCEIDNMNDLNHIVQFINQNYLRRT